MSEQTNSVAIGAFVVGALLIAVAAIVFLLGTGFSSGSSKAVMVFDGSVKGLNLGAPVALRGVQIGQVTDIDLILDSDSVELIMLVEAEIRDDNVQLVGGNTETLTEQLISRGLRAQLNTQSILTGLLYVQLDFHPGSPIKLADIDSPYLQIPAIPTELERITRKLESIDFVKMAGDLESIASNLNEFVSGDDFQKLPSQLQGTLASLATLSDDLGMQVKSSGPRLDRLLDGASDTMATANTQISLIAKRIDNSLAAIDAVIPVFEQSMRDLGELVDPDSETVYEANRALGELAAAGRALQELGRTLEEHPESLLRGRRGDP